MSDEFAVYMLNEDGVRKAKNLQETFERCLTEVAQVCPPGGREYALVVTNLQQASFWAKRGMAVNPVNQKANTDE